MQFRHLLKLDPKLDRYRVVVGYGASDSRSIAVTTRAMTGVLYYLSQGVSAPESDVNQGRVTRTLTASGEPFDWRQMLEGVISIDFAAEQPKHAAVAVPYRNGWYYISDADLQSKSTFSLLAQLMTLQAGPEGARGTALSFSVGSS